MIKIKESQKENITQILEVNTSEVKTVYFSKQPQKKRLQFEIETEEKGWELVCRQKSISTNTWFFDEETWLANRFW